MSAWTSLDIRPSRSLPPGECWRGTSPTDTAKFRPRRKWDISGAKASIDSAVSGPTPGIIYSRLSACGAMVPPPTERQPQPRRPRAREAGSGAMTNSSGCQTLVHKGFRRILIGEDSTKWDLRVAI